MPRARLYPAAALIVIFSLLIPTSAYQTSHANSSYLQAVRLNNTGQYSSALQLLSDTDTSFVLPQTARKVTHEKSRSETWLGYSKDQERAKNLAKDAKYAEALSVLQAIDKDYPSYDSVLADIAVIAAQQADAQIAAGKQAEAAKKAAEANKPKAPRKKVAVVSPVSGRRYTSTAATAALASSANLTQAQQALQLFFSQYGVTMQITNVTPSSFINKWTTYTLLNESDLPRVKTYGAIMIDEWSKYPVSWVKNSNLKYMVYVKTISSGGITLGSNTDPVGHAMYYDPIYETSYGDSYARETLHHEYGHLIETAFFGDYVHPDPTWDSFNPPGFKYGNGGASCYVTPSSCMTGEHPIQGFATGYGASSVAEDKAEIYAYLMTTEYYKKLKTWVASDPLLAKKVSTYQAFMASHSPEMTGDYYDAINK